MAASTADHILKRRLLLVGGALGLLAGCTTGSTSPLSSVIPDVEAIAQGFLGVLPTIGTIAGLDPARVADIGALIGNLQSLSEQLRSVGSLKEAQPFIRQVEHDVNAITMALAGIPILPPPVSLALSAASVLLPVIEAAVNLIVAVAPRRPQERMSPEQARLTLKSLAPR